MELCLTQPSRFSIVAPMMMVSRAFPVSGFELRDESMEFHLVLVFLLVTMVTV